MLSKPQENLNAEPTGGELLFRGVKEVCAALRKILEMNVNNV